jgi:hypothetical protein
LYTTPSSNDGFILERKGDERWSLREQDVKKARAYLEVS